MNRIPAVRTKAPQLRRLPLDLIDEPPLPMRETMGDVEMAELMESLRALGQLQPIIVIPREDRYEIVDGHRRYIAARDLRWTEISALVCDQRGLALEAAKCHSNLLREAVNPAEEAIYYAQLLDQYKLDEAGLCELVRRSPDVVGDRLRLLRGDPRVLDAVRQARINFAVGRELNKIGDETLRLYYLDAAMRSGCSSRVVAEWVREWRANSTAPAMPAPAAAPAGETPAPAPYQMACFLCGGSLDPYNLENVWVHKWELEDIRRLMREAAEKRAR